MDMKNMIFLGIGIVVGGGIAYKLTSDAARKMYSEEIESMQDYYECKLSEMEPEMEDKDITDEKDPYEVDRKIMQDIAQDNGYIDYSTKTAEKNERKKRGEEIEKALNNLPIVISPAEYAMSDEEVTNVGYEWYSGNKVLVDEKGEAIDPLTTLGINPDDYFERNPDDPDTIYMRNETLKIDIEIIRVDGDYEAE